MKQEKTISKEIEQYGGDWPPEDARGFLVWFQEKIDAVPKEFRDTVRIELDSIESYGSSRATIEISYVRPETDEEEIEREQKTADRIASQQAAASHAQEIERWQAECEKLRSALRRTVLTYVVDDEAWDREADADRAMQYAMTRP